MKDKSTESNKQTNTNTKEKVRKNTENIKSNRSKGRHNTPHRGLSGEPFMNSMHLADEIRFLRRVLRSTGGALGAVDTRDVFAACKRYNSSFLHISFNHQGVNHSSYFSIIFNFFFNLYCY